MRNRFIILIILFFNSIVFYGQYSVKSRIVDEDSNNPIPFASIWLKNKNIGTTSDTNGYFTLKADSNYSNRIIIISSIGYIDTLIQIGKIKSEIKLKPKIYQISEIKVFPRKSKELILNDLSKVKIGGGIMNDTTPQIIGRYFPYSKDYDNFQYLKSVIIYSRDINKGKFNLRIYSFDTIKIIPIDELIHENIIVNTKLSLFGQPKPIEFDLSKYKIIFPKSGIFIGIEWLIIPENRYKVSFTSKDKKRKKIVTMYCPNLAATYDSIGHMYICKSGFWWKPVKNPKIEGYFWSELFSNPAVSLKLTD